jgi:hypothetical protein
MKSSLTVQAVLSDIEFEIAQGTISRQELGQGVRAAKQYQNKLRADTFQTGRALADLHELVDRQFQINDIHLTLLQEMAAAIQSLQLDLRRVGRLQKFTPAMTTQSEASPADWLATPIDLSEYGEIEQAEWWQPEQIEQAMRSDALSLKSEVRSVRAPIIGSLITRVRSALHSLALFYINLLAQRQTQVNQVYGERILQLSRLHQMQYEQLEMLKIQLAGSGGHAPDTESPIDTQHST